MNKRKTIIGGGIILLLAGTAWAFGLFGGTDPAVAKLNDLRAQMGDKNLNDAQRSALRGEFRQQVQSLTEDQRRSFFQSGRADWEARQQQRMNEFFTMSKADQQKRLDEILNRMLQAQKQSQAGAQAQNQVQGQNANGNQGNRGNRGNRAGMTAEQREERSKQRIENTDPKTRAQFAQFRKALDNRAAERGISVPPGGMGRGFGPRGA